MREAELAGHQGREEGDCIPEVGSSGDTGLDVLRRGSYPGTGSELRTVPWKAGMDLLTETVKEHVGLREISKTLGGKSKRKEAEPWGQESEASQEETRGWWWKESRAAENGDGRYSVRVCSLSLGPLFHTVLSLGSDRCLQTKMKEMGLGQSGHHL